MNYEERMSWLNNFDRKEVTVDFGDSPYADRAEEVVEPDTNDPNRFTEEGNDIE